MTIHVILGLDPGIFLYGSFYFCGTCFSLQAFCKRKPCHFSCKKKHCVIPGPDPESVKDKVQPKYGRQEKWQACHLQGAFRGSAGPYPLHCHCESRTLRQAQGTSLTMATNAPPIPAAIEYATIVSTGSFRKKTPRASLLAPIPAVLGSAKISRQPMHLHKDTVTLNCYATFARTCYECGFRVCLIYSTA